MPGITGWAQVNGRNGVTWPDKFNLDVWYVDHLSWKLDLQILGMTVWKILKREGINEPGHAIEAITNARAITRGRTSHRERAEVLLVPARELRPRERVALAAEMLERVGRGHAPEP